MKFPSPKNANEYPIYIVGYWILSFIILFSVTVLVFVVPHMTSSGRYVKHRDCIRESTTGYYDETTVCDAYGEEYYTTIGDDIKSWIFASAVMSGLVCVGYGAFAWREKYYAEKYAKKLEMLEKSHIKKR